MIGIKRGFWAVLVLLPFLSYAHGNKNSYWEVVNNSNKKIRLTCWKVFSYPFSVNKKSSLQSEIFTLPNCMPGNKEGITLDYTYADGMGYPEPDSVIKCQYQFRRTSKKERNGPKRSFSFVTQNYGDYVQIIFDEDSSYVLTKDVWNNVPYKKTIIH